MASSPLPNAVAEVFQGCLKSKQGTSTPGVPPPAWPVLSSHILSCEACLPKAEPEWRRCPLSARPEYDLEDHLAGHGICRGSTDAGPVSDEARSRKLRRLDPGAQISFHVDSYNRHICAAQMSSNSRLLDRCVSLRTNDTLLDPLDFLHLLFCSFSSHEYKWFHQGTKCSIKRLHPIQKQVDRSLPPIWIPYAPTTIYVVVLNLHYTGLTRPLRYT